jgi:UDP-3-O-[3-hydroxymyristoyl] glucosamine N-acyltransferase
LFYPERRPPAGVDPTARLGPGVTLGEGCSVGPYVVLGAAVSLGRHVVLHPFVCLGDEVRVGDDSVLFPHVTVYERVTLGRRVRVHSGAVIGADGFGFVLEAGMPRKVPQVGSVVIEDDVEIGANAGVDRATTGVTWIGAGSKLDNMVQVGHNVRMGRGCRIAALVGIGGSSEFGDGVVIGGVAGVKDHVHIGSGSMVGAMAAVWKDVPPGTVVSGQPARPHREQLRAQAAATRFADADERIRELERRVRAAEARLEIEEAGGPRPGRRHRP